MKLFSVTTALLAAAYVGLIIAANWAVQDIGIVGVGFGLTAPAGVLFVGLIFTVRDFLHERIGTYGVFAMILIGAALSYYISPALATASAVAFLVSELSDLGVYAPLRERRWLLAVLLSNTVGLVIDSLLFLKIAFGSIDYAPGQIVAKGYMTIAAVLVLLAVRRGRQSFTPVLRGA